MLQVFVMWSVDKYWGWTIVVFQSKWGTKNIGPLYTTVKKSTAHEFLEKFWNLIGQEWYCCRVVVYTMAKKPLVENFVHGCKDDMATLWWRGVLCRSSFLGNLKTLDKKLGLWITPTWMKYYFLREIFALLFSLFGMTRLGNTQKIVLSRCRLFINMTNGVSLSYYWENTNIQVIRV